MDKRCLPSKNVDSCLQRSSLTANWRYNVMCYVSKGSVVKWSILEGTFNMNEALICTLSNSNIMSQYRCQNWGTLLSTSIGSNANVPTPVDGNSIPDNRCLFPRISASAQHTQYCTKQGTMNECKEINLPILTQDESFILILLFINITLDCNCATVLIINVVLLNWLKNDATANLTKALHSVTHNQGFFRQLCWHNGPF